ncbi:host cell division inhibitor Icd-like protein [uncultured Gilliamella sp.]|uniref:host cell division inhibitor Icd-like protein n=1 Tax=uncultured Gilliamella sp. TaxID=1193505 RepID=UPI0025EC1450|nr:host cell division inhibitor Icd-like protein [uncultured Gilliamella sp.]
MTTSLYNNLAIQMYPQPLNNRPVKRYGAIFRHVREDFIDITTRARMRRKTHCMGLNFKKWFCQSIKREIKKQIPPKSGIKMANYFLFGLVSFSRQAEITKVKIKKRLHEFQNLGYINLALAKSSVRIGTLFILLATHDALSVFFCVNARAHLFIKSFSMVALVGHPKGWLVSSRASSSNPANVTANEIGTSSGDYLNNYLLEAVIMTTTPNPIVSTQKLFKFYDLSTAQVIQTTATTEREARKSLGKQSLIFIARIRLTPIIERARTWGGYSHE